MNKLGKRSKWWSNVDVDIQENKEFLKGKGEMDCVNMEFFVKQVTAESKDSFQSSENNSESDDIKTNSGSGSSNEGIQKMISLMREVKYSNDDTNDVKLNKIIESSNQEFQEEKKNLIKRLGLKNIEYLEFLKFQNITKKSEAEMELNEINEKSEEEKKQFTKRFERFETENIFAKFFNGFLVKFKDYE